jgi:Fic family protein
MDKFQKKLKFNFKENHQILNLISSIDAFREKWNTVEKRENVYLRELRRIATIESIGSSTRIEGAQMSNKEIKELLDNLEITNLMSRDQQEVIGYSDVLEIIYENYRDIKILKNYIQQLHQSMLKYSTKDERHRGKYKNTSNKVVASYPDGTQRVVFNTTEPHLVESEMDELIEWVNQQFELKEIHPLIISAVFIYEFLSIHPFQDGNGRLSRLLTNLLLMKNGYLFIRYVSFEYLVEQRKKSFYEALMVGQKDRYAEKERINKWMIYFLSSIETLKTRLEQKYDVYKSKGGYLNERQKKIKDFIEKEQPLKLGDISQAFHEISIHTIKKDLQYLKTEQVIDSIGNKRGTIYIMKEK